MNIAYKDRIRTAISGRRVLVFRDLEYELNRTLNLCITPNEIRGHLKANGYRSDGNGKFTLVIP